MNLGLEETQKGRVHTGHCPQNPELRHDSLTAPSVSPALCGAPGMVLWALGVILGAGESSDFWAPVQGL